MELWQKRLSTLLFGVFIQIYWNEFIICQEWCCSSMVLKMLLEYKLSTFFHGFSHGKYDTEWLQLWFCALIAAVSTGLTSSWIHVESNSLPIFSNFVANWILLFGMHRSLAETINSFGQHLVKFAVMVALVMWQPKSTWTNQASTQYQEIVHLDYVESDEDMCCIQPPAPASPRIRGSRKVRNQ